MLLGNRGLQQRMCKSYFMLITSRKWRGTVKRNKRNPKEEMRKLILIRVVKKKGTKEYINTLLTD